MKIIPRPHQNNNIIIIIFAIPTVHHVYSINKANFATRDNIGVYRSNEVFWWIISLKKNKKYNHYLKPQRATLRSKSNKLPVHAISHKRKNIIIYYLFCV